MLSEPARKKADEAQGRGLWLFDPQYKMWYSPEEFKHIFHHSKADETFLARLQMRNPKDAVDMGFKRLAEIQNKLHIFAKRGLDYYKK